MTDRCHVPCYIILLGYIKEGGRKYDTKNKAYLHND